MTSIPRQKLTKKLIAQLQNEPGPLDQVVVWCVRNPDEFFNFMAKNYPEWLEQRLLAAWEADPYAYALAKQRFLAKKLT